MRYAPLLLLLLCGCSSITDANTGPPPLQPVQPPSQVALQKGFGIVVKDARLTLPVEASLLRRTDHGPGDYFACLREANPLPGKPHYIYSVFFDDEAYKGARQSVILEDCEHQQYVQTSIVVETTPPAGGPPNTGRPQ